MPSINSLFETLQNIFPLRTFGLHIHDLTISITAPEDLEELVNRITNEEFQQDERIPYWADVWHSAIGLGEFMRKNPQYVSAKKTLELGCGLGVCGIVAASCGADVTLSDYDDHALLAAELNLRTNNPAAIAEFVSLDFRTPPQRRWDCVIAADIIYEQRFIDPLVRCIDAVLEPGGVLLLAHPNREVSETLVTRLVEHGFVKNTFIVPASMNAHTVHVSVEVITRRTPHNM
jgi:predicted nicotinamide N-methyase